jgi:hypothetical protein
MDKAYARQLHQSGAARIAVYSCYFGQHEPFNPDATGSHGAGYDRFVFTDHEILPGTTARLIALSDPGLGPAILSRLPKLCPHLFFAGYDWVIYLDNNARFLLDPARVIRRIAKEHPGTPQGRYLFRHRRRDCIWDEADECLRLGFMTPAQHAQISGILTAAAYPRHAGLFVNTCMIQRMGCAATDRLNTEWFESLTSITRRDQVMLPFLLWQSGVAHRTLRPKVKDWAEWPVFSESSRTRFRTALKG